MCIHTNTHTQGSWPVLQQAQPGQLHMAMVEAKGRRIQTTYKSINIHTIVFCQFCGLNNDTNILFSLAIYTVQLQTFTMIFFLAFLPQFCTAFFFFLKSCPRGEKFICFQLKTFSSHLILTCCHLIFQYSLYLQHSSWFSALKMRTGRTCLSSES